MAYTKKANRVVKKLSDDLTTEEAQYVDKLIELYKTIELPGVDRRTTVGNYSGLLELGVSCRGKWSRVVKTYRDIVWCHTSSPSEKLHAEHILVAQGWLQVGGSIY